METSEKLAILVPDGAYPLVLHSLISERRASIGIRAVNSVIIKDAFRDSSREGVSLLRPYLRSCSHALIIRDLDGSGWESRGLVALEEDLKRGMQENGWSADRCEAIIVEPEIEAWLRFDSTHFHKIVRDRARRHKEEADLLLQTIIAAKTEEYGGLNRLGKPMRPKEVLESVFAHFGIQRGNAIYETLAKAEGLRGCKVPSFLRLVELLRAWFPQFASGG